MPSSISSSDRPPRRFPREWLIAACLFLAVNAAVAVLARAGYVSSANPRTMIEGRLALAAATRSNVWMFGNSLLDRSVNPDALGRALGETVERFISGSSSFAFNVRLAQASLDAAGHPPHLLAFFVSKDDFNRNGDRGAASARYMESFGPPSLHERLTSALPLFAYRTSLRGQLSRPLVALGRRTETRVADTPMPAAGLSNIEDAELMSRWASSTYLANQGAAFEFDSQGFAGLERLVSEGKRRGTRIVVIVAPVSRAVGQWQDANGNGVRYAEILRRIQAGATGAGALFLDQSGTMPSNRTVFADAYHLTSEARDVFTDRFAHDIEAEVAASRESAPRHAGED